MLTWAQANQVALLASSRAHAGEGVDLSQSRVDVVAAIRSAKVELLWRPMPRVFGLYVNEPGAKVGILVNSGLHGGARRHTAAHEFGHHWFEHSTTVDDEWTVDVSGSRSLGSDNSSAVDLLPAAGRRRRWTDQEKVAEAFAVWFLMPRRVVQNALNEVGVTRPASAMEVYRASTILGTSYATTLRHLPNLRMATTADVERWGKIQPGVLKARLDHGVVAPDDRRKDVIVLDGATSSSTVHAESGDRIVLPGVSEEQLNAPAWCQPVGVTNAAEYADGLVLEVGDLDEQVHGSLSVAGWTIPIQAGPQPEGREPEEAA